MAYASVTYTSASGTTFALTNSSGNPIQYLRQADIAVTVNGILKTQGTDYTFNTAGTAIVLGTAVSGATVVITRTTDIADASVSFTAGSTLTAQDLNNSDKQNRFALQEFSDTYGALTTGSGDLSALAGFIGSSETWLSDNAHAPTTGAVDNRIDSKITTNNANVILRDGSQAMQAALSLGGFKITNLATPTSNTDASTKAYVDSNVGSVSASATAAAASAAAALTSETNAASSASSASTSASNASTSASNASTSASSASTSASNASTSASNAATSETNAANSATSAASSAASALAAFDSFDDRYLGAKATDPTVDNDGDPLNAGDLYYNTTSSVMKVYTGSVWVVAYVPGDAVNISFTPYGNISSTNVQNAIQEVVDELAPDKISEGNSSVEVVDTGTGEIVFTADGSQISKITASGGYSGTGSDIRRLAGGVMCSELNADGVTLGVRSIGGGNKSELRFLGNTVSDWVGFKAPSSLSSAIIWTLPNADGISGQALKTNGSGTLSWGTAGGASGAGGDDVFYENGQTVTTSYTLTAGKNALSAGPITINSGVTVTVGSGQSWVIV
jgi:hypothetical protein